MKNVKVIKMSRRGNRRDRKDKLSSAVEEKSQVLRMEAKALFSKAALFRSM